MTDPMDDMIPLADAARILGITPETLRTWTHTGRVAGVTMIPRRGPHQVSGRCVPRSEVERLRQERGTVGHQKPSDWTPMTDREKRYG